MVKAKVRKAGHHGGTDRRKGSSVPGWIYLLMGLSIGLTVAYAVYVNSNKKLAQPAGEPVSAPAEKPAARKPQLAVVEDEPVAPGEVTFDFYDMLPNLDVELYEIAKAPATATAAPPAVSKPGIYIIQAGSFGGLAEANKRKAELGLLGIHSEIKTGDANGQTVYRVYTDPMENPEDVNRASKLLTGAGIDILPKRVSD